MVPPNELYTAFSFVGFVLCAVPFYWHLEAWNVGTCLYMAWTGLGCLVQCINSIVWNKNMTNKAPVYCDISTRIQAGINAAIPACILCINRRLYKITTMKAVMPTGAEKRRAAITDLLIGLGIPILQLILQCVVSRHRYVIWEDCGPYLSTVLMLPSYFLFLGWPLVIGVVSSTYGVRTIYAFYKRRQRLKEIVVLNSGLSHSRYLRLMILSSMDLLGTIPLATYFTVLHVRRGIIPWKSWDDTHRNYSLIPQIPASVWKNNRDWAQGVELYRWSLVLCAFLFFAFFGLANEARENYRRAFTWFARRVGYLTSPGTANASSHLTSSPPDMKRKGGAAVHVATTTSTPTSRGENGNSSASFSDRLSISSIPVNKELKSECKIGWYLQSVSIGSSSEDDLEPELQAQSTVTELAITMPAVPPTSVPPRLPDTAKSTVRAYSSIMEIV